MCFTPVCRVRKGYTNAECHLPYLRPNRFLQESLLQLCGATLISTTARSQLSKAFGLCLYQTVARADWGRWRDPGGARNHGITMKTVLLKAEGHNQEKIKINHLV